MFAAYQALAAAAEAPQDRERAEDDGEVLAVAEAVVAEPPAALLGVVGEGDAVGDPGRVLREVRRELVVGEVHEEALRPLDAAPHEP